MPGFNQRVMVAQIGARRRYAVPAGLSKAGRLHLLVTDACASAAPWRHLGRLLPPRLRPPALSAVLARSVDEVDTAKVRGCFGMFLSIRVGRLRPRPEEPRVSYWVRQNQAFGRAVSRLDWRGADCVYAFNGAALEIFEEAKRRGLPCVLDQTAAPWRFNSELLAREQGQWPGWEDFPADCDCTGQMIAREQAEWELADRIVCGSSFVVEAVRNTGGPADKCVVVPYPLPLAPRLAARPPRADGPCRVLFAGTLQLRKGIQYVWDAARRLQACGFEFRAIGPSHLEPRGEAAVRTYVNWRGPVAREDVWSHYAWADVLLLPTLSEGSANVCWEALAAGVPVVTTTAAGVDPEKVRMTRADTDEIVESLLAVHACPWTKAGSDVPARTVVDYGMDLAAALT